MQLAAHWVDGLNVSFCVRASYLFISVPQHSTCQRKHSFNKCLSSSSYSLGAEGRAAGMTDGILALKSVLWWQLIEWSECVRISGRQSPLPPRQGSLTEGCGAPEMEQTLPGPCSLKTIGKMLKDSGSAPPPKQGAEPLPREPSHLSLLSVAPTLSLVILLKFVSFLLPSLFPTRSSRNAGLLLLPVFCFPLDVSVCLV